MSTTMGRTKWVCTVPGCTANPSKRNNIERHVWLQHVRKWQNADAQEDYRVTSHKHYVEPYIRRYDGPNIITPPDTPPSMPASQPLLDVPAGHAGRKFKHERASSLGSVRAVRSRPYDLPVTPNDPFASYPSSAVSSPMLQSPNVHGFSNRAQTPRIHATSPNTDPDPLSFLAKACEYQAQMDGLGQDVVLQQSEDYPRFPNSLAPYNASVFDFQLAGNCSSFAQTPRDTPHGSPAVAPMRPGEIPRLLTWPGVLQSANSNDSPTAMQVEFFAAAATERPSKANAPSPLGEGPFHYNPYHGTSSPRGLQKYDTPMGMELSVSAQAGDDVWRPW
eukprot:comp22935_c0_seq1/m.36341 comp22935_c0_seq1/g.36341  ORF comp22935_c0_seq1/g.36341 comp22935_c0_seq1/m.36341 type:complete len:333 (-) comp22935_c0_seq1:426-1424(-)